MHLSISVPDGCHGAFFIYPVNLEFIADKVLSRHFLLAFNSYLNLSSKGWWANMQSDPKGVTPVIFEFGHLVLNDGHSCPNGHIYSLTLVFLSLYVFDLLENF